MSSNQHTQLGVSTIFSFLKRAIKGEEQDYTEGSLRKALFMLAIPMVLEMVMESVFAVVDIFFVGKLGKDAVSTVGLTESVLAIVYSLAIGLSMAATALVSRRIGEKNPEEAAKAGMQAVLLSVIISVLISIAGVFFSKNILQLMGASAEIVEVGSTYTQIIFGSNIVIILLFLINGIFRGAGDASIAMRSLWIANICNIILCPLLIYGLGPFQGFGLTGAALATTFGRGFGVCYQLFHLFSGKRIIKIGWKHLQPDMKIIRSVLSIAWTATFQFLIASASWIVLAKIVARFGSAAIAGYTVALRIIMFFILPAWGLSNAAATLVGQNLGAGKPDRAEQSVWKAAKYNALFMIFVSVIILLFSEQIIRFMNNDKEVEIIASQALRIISFGYIFFGVGMVITSSFNGAGDTKTPTWINLFGFWTFQIPLAYMLAISLDLGPTGVFFAIVITETLITIVGIIIFRKGKWKLVKI
ncbi:MAG: MATE family efflux transporter [Chitinophagaceae bacterium]